MRTLFVYLLLITIINGFKWSDGVGQRIRQQGGGPVRARGRGNRGGGGGSTAVATTGTVLPVLMDSRDVCKRARRHSGASGSGGRLAELCRDGSELLKRIEAGIQLATFECHLQFRNRRWNCTTVRRSLRKVLMRDTRETGFVNAIIAAGITYEVTRACTRGDLVECSCEKTSRLAGPKSPRGTRLVMQTHPPAATTALGGSIPSSPGPTMPAKVAKTTNTAESGDWEWGGCGDNVNFGYRKSKDFLDARYRRRSDIKTLVKLHNHDAGRLAIRNFMSTECKCHGLSGSCTLRTCWRKMPPFREIGNRLKERFDGAAKVIARNDGRSFMPEGENIKPPGRMDIVYTDDSPDFCSPNRKTGSLGTHGRQCEHGSQGVGGCDLLCCNRGFTSRDNNVTRNCKCRFQWCCEVHCETCLETVRVHTCH